MDRHERPRGRRALTGVATLALAVAALGCARLGAIGAMKKSFIPIPEIITDPNEGNTFGDLGYWEGRAFVLGSVVQERDSTDRFYGFGNRTSQNQHPTLRHGLRGGESNYTGENTVAQVTPGVWLLPHVNLSYRMRIRRF